MTTIEQAIDVKVPASKAYDQWTQFEEFPRFMAGVESVAQLDKKRLHWRAEIGGVTEEWDAEITEQIPDKRIAWRSNEGAMNAGVVTFHRLSDDETRVMVQLAYQPTGLIENVGDYLGIVKRRIKGDLECFKEFIEGRADATAQWRGGIPSKDDIPAH